MRRARPSHSVHHSLACALLALCALFWPGVAAAQIKQPGAHPDYALELDPHLTIQHARGPFWDDEGIGLGLRASIPFLKNGPIRQINNNMAMSFGGDFTFFGSGNGCRSRVNSLLGDDCSANELWLPVAVQWNFFLTRVVSVFGEVGLAISYAHRSWQYNCGDAICDGNDSDLDFFNGVFFAGGRFLFSERAGMTVRLGWPYISVGGSFLL